MYIFSVQKVIFFVFMKRGTNCDSMLRDVEGAIWVDLLSNTTANIRKVSSFQHRSHRNWKKWTENWEPADGLYFFYSLQIPFLFLSSPFCFWQRISTEFSKRNGAVEPDVLYIVQLTLLVRNSKSQCVLRNGVPLCMRMDLSHK